MYARRGLAVLPALYGLNNFVAGRIGPSKARHPGLGIGVERQLKCFVEGMRAQTATVHRREHLHTLDRMQVEAVRDAVGYYAQTAALLNIDEFCGIR